MFAIFYNFAHIITNYYSLQDMKKVISTPKAPAAIGPYSQAIQVGNLIYTSGQIPIDPATGQLVEGGVKEVW